MFLFKECLVEVELLLSFDRVNCNAALLSSLKAVDNSKARQFSHVTW